MPDGKRHRSLISHTCHTWTSPKSPCGKCALSFPRSPLGAMCNAHSMRAVIGLFWLDYRIAHAGPAKAASDFARDAQEQHSPVTAVGSPSKHGRASPTPSMVNGPGFGSSRVVPEFPRRPDYSGAQLCGPLKYKLDSQIRGP
jgi:hypothetical protein